MKLLNSYIIKEHITPFFYALFVIMFILLMNFLVNYINELFGKGLSAWTILRLIAFNTSWMLALAVPMATLVAVLTAYGRFSADNEITILKSSGISIINIIRPSIYAGVVLTIAMVYFSDQILPEANHQAALMFRSIRQKKPTLSLNENVFYPINHYTLVVEKIERPLAEEWLSLDAMLGPEYHDQKQMDRLRNLTIYDSSDPTKDVIITAQEGYMVYSPARKALIFTLFDGEFHELENSEFSEYRRSAFKRQVVYIPVENFEFEDKTAKKQNKESDNTRGDREMNIQMMSEKVDKYRDEIARQRQKVAGYLNADFKISDSLTAASKIMADNSKRSGLDGKQQKNALKKAIRQAERREQQMRTAQNIIETNERNINKYLVEIHKKVSIPFACLVFVLVGAPLGVMSRRGSMGVASSISIFFFLLYWIFLIGGENLADRRFISPALAMWAPNILVGLAGVYLTWRAVKESTFIPWEQIPRLFKKITSPRGQTIA